MQSFNLKIEPQYYSSLITSYEMKFIEVISNNDLTLININNISYIKSTTINCWIYLCDGKSIECKNSYIEIKKKLGLE